MEIFIVALFGLFLGSFVNALVWRLRQQSLSSKKKKYSDKELSITKGRSICTNCGHKLSYLDLVPVFSWIFLRRKCRYCNKTISWQYPIIELAVSLVLVVSYLSWPFAFSGLGVALFIIWSFMLTGLAALFVYDIKWMLLPNKIIFPLYFLAAIFIVLRIIQDRDLTVLTNSLFGILVGGGIFYILFQLSGGKWIGGGDVKLGFLLGAILGGALESALALFIASVLGSLLSLPLLLSGKIDKNVRIPFGPFLIIGLFITFLYGSKIIDAYLNFTGIQ